MRQNLALVVGLQGRFAEAETIAKGDLPADEATANVAYLREMLSRKDKDNSRPPGSKATVPVAALNRPGLSPFTAVVAASASAVIRYSSELFVDRVERPVLLRLVPAAHLRARSFAWSFSGSA